MSGSPSDAPAPPATRPGAWYFVVIVALVAVGVLSPLGVSWYVQRTARTIPVDTTGNRPDRAPASPLPADSSPSRP